MNKNNPTVVVDLTNGHRVMRTNYPNKARWYIALCPNRKLQMMPAVKYNQWVSVRRVFGSHGDFN